jgi:carbon-monoxide dehydrogenase large subunit
LKDGEVRVVGSDRSVKFAELSRILKGAPGYGFPPGVDPGLDANVNWRTDALAYANACHAAEVEVDIETGAVRVVNYVAMQDSGVLINPMLVEGQVQGGIAHSIGQVLFERTVYDENGQLLTGEFMDYPLPRATDIPEYVLGATYTPSPVNPLGIKGVGEAGTIGATPAIANAVLDALEPLGVAHLDLPMTPERVWQAIKTRTTATV